MLVPSYSSIRTLRLKTRDSACTTRESRGNLDRVVASPAAGEAVEAVAVVVEEEEEEEEADGDGEVVVVLGAAVVEAEEETAYRDGLVGWMMFAGRSVGAVDETMIYCVCVQLHAGCVLECLLKKRSQDRLGWWYRWIVFDEVYDVLHTRNGIRFFPWFSLSGYGIGGCLLSKQVGTQRSIKSRYYSHCSTCTQHSYRADVHASNVI